MINAIRWICITGGALLFLSGCVSQKKYQDALLSVESLQQDSLKADSLGRLVDQLQDEVRTVEGLYQSALFENEQYKAASKNIYTSYQDLQQRYEDIINNRQDVLSTSSYEKQSLLEQLAAYQEEIDKKEQYLRQVEWELAQKEERMNQISNQDFAQDLAQRDQIIRQLQAQLQQKNAVLQQIQQKISESLYKLSQSDFSVEEKRGKLYISMSQELLFKSGSAKLDRKGRRALKDLADAIKNNPNIDILVEGHTDTDGSAEQNWNLSVERAVAVVRELVDAGVDPTRLTAAGRAFYQPVATNNTAAGKALNRRTEIIISPKLDELMDLVRQQ